MNNVPAIVCVVIHFLLASKASATASKIVGGGKAPPEYGKFHASLQNLTGHHVCGGAIVSSKHLVTAAHCVVGAEPKYIKVVVGTVDLDEGGLFHNIQTIHVHPRYNSTLRLNDIAVLEIIGSFNPNYVEVLGIPVEKVKEDENVLLVGFGAREPNGESSRRMLALNVTVFCQETCRYAMRYTRDVYDTMFCTFTEKGQGTCHGASEQMGYLIESNCRRSSTLAISEELQVRYRPL